MLFVLPTDELLIGRASIDQLLAKIEISLKDLIAMIVARWAEEEAGWSISGMQYLPTDATVQEKVQLSLMEDYLADELVAHRLSPEDLHVLTQLIRSCCHEVFDEIIVILEDMQLTDYQLQTLKICKWLGRSLVVDIVV